MRISDVLDEIEAFRKERILEKADFKNLNLISITYSMEEKEVEEDFWFN